MTNFNRRDGFTGQQMIVLPNRVINKIIHTDPLLEHMYITQIGYFPKALFHYRERRNGCADNILLYCTEGRGWYVIGKTRYEVSANQYVILPATDRYMRYGADNDDPWTIHWVHFTGTTIDMFNKTMKITLQRGPGSIHYNSFALKLWTTMYQSLEQAHSRENVINAILCLHAFIASFLFKEMYLQEPAMNSGKMIADTIAYMKEHIGEKISIETFAARCNLSASYFSSLFKGETGKAPLEYFIQLKVHHACTLLVSSRMKVKEIAAMVGYDDPYYFCRIFKKLTKTSPKKYMQLNHAKT
ncbi:AraC family transcriptional regulator [Niabella beijingensis]|uniref:AraC family transcriptional regulator n=1 Tax=Niabella beijingensis TaxID=2872700 RepID=UPI001CBB745B|nr:AraC family transcriptional regulator [Niabella beijingensis]MBZ4187371.1 AraC family transcriptional regulator [Niabella beijingensis]